MWTCGRCDNTGKNKQHVSDVAASSMIYIKQTAPNMPQMNGIVKRRLTVVKDMSKTMMEAANLPKSTQNFLWPEAIRCANMLYNITTNGNNMKTPYERFTGENLDCIVTSFNMDKLDLGRFTRKSRPPGRLKPNR